MDDVVIHFTGKHVHLNFGIFVSEVVGCTTTPSTKHWIPSDVVTLVPNSLCGLGRPHMAIRPAPSKTMQELNVVAELDSASSKTAYPDWQQDFQAALLELDPQKL